MDVSDSGSTPDDPDWEPKPVQPGEWCPVCANRIPEGADTITLIGFGEVQEVDTLDCAEHILQMWRESAADGCDGC